MKGPAKILILIMTGEVGKNSDKCTLTQASLSYHLQNEKKSEKHGCENNESELCCDQSRLSIALRAATKRGQVASELISIPATLEVSI